MRTNVKCPNKIPWCDGVDEPFANLSSEAADPVSPVYFGEFVDSPTGAPIEYLPPEPGPGTTFGNVEQTSRITCPDGTEQTYTTPARWFFGNTQEEADAAALNFANTATADMCGGLPAPVPPNPNPDPFPPGPDPDPNDPELPPGGTELNCPEGYHNDNGTCVIDNPTPPNPNPPPGQMYSNVAKSCNIPCTDGLPFWYTVRAGLFKSNKGQKFVNDQAYTEACRLATYHQICLADLDTTGCTYGCGCAGQDYYAAITASGNGLIPASAGGTAANWSLVSGSLPPGLSIMLGAQPIANHSSTILITGTPTTVGTYTFLVRVTTASGFRQTKIYTLVIKGITNPTALTQADFLYPYSYTLSQSGLTGTIKWSFFDALSPTGLTLDENTGEISGTPTVPGDYTFVVQVATVDSGGVVLFRCLKTFTLKVSATILAWVHLVPLADLNSELLSWHYTDVTSGFHEDLGSHWAAGTYTFEYVSGAFIQYNAGGDDYYTHAADYDGNCLDPGYQYHGDYITYSGGLDSKYFCKCGDYLCGSVPEVEAREAGFFITFDHLGGNISVTYSPNPADLPTAQNVGDNSIWSLKQSTPEGTIKNTDILIGTFVAGDYVLFFHEGAADFESAGWFSTRGQNDEIVDDNGTVLTAVPARISEEYCSNAETAAKNEYFTFHHPGGNMYWRLKTPSTTRIIYDCQFPLWYLYVAVP